jgi:hypothetical protein
MKMKKIILLAAIATVGAFAQVDKPIEMPYYDYPMVQKDHYEVVAANCLTCHSFGYVLNQGKKRNRSYWTGTVRKMVDEFKAPISKEDSQIIINYLVKNYGDGK